MNSAKIVIKKACVHNLKSVDLELPVGAFIVFTGVSGSGKSSLAFDTIYTEGQRRYIESLPSQARRQLDVLSRPECESIEGLSPTIAIEQKTVGKNPRSTVGTLTGLYDYLRVLYARMGQPHCPISGQPVQGLSKEELAEHAYEFAFGYRAIILAPLVRGRKGEFKDLLVEAEKNGFRRCRVDGEIYDLSDQIDLDPKKTHDIDLVIDRLEVIETDKTRFLEAIFVALDQSQGLVRVLLFDQNTEKLYSTGNYSQESGLSYPDLNIQDFSFNHPEGMCSECQGLGIIHDFDLSTIIDENKSIENDCISLAPSYDTVKWGNIYRNLAELYDFDVSTPWKDLSEDAKKIILYGAGDQWIKMLFKHPHKRSSWTDYVKWHGVLHEARRRFEDSSSELYKDKMKQMMQEMVCPSCMGSRIKPFPSATQLFGKKIHELTALCIEDLKKFLESVTLNEKQKIIGQELLKEVLFGLNYLVGVGIGYLSLSRPSPTLSGGEAQRVRLAAQLGCGLAGITYVLDEPSIGLHPSDNTKLIETLCHLRDQGNTVIVVEHDEETLLASDFVVEIGPGAGSEGGKIIFSGTPQELLKAKDSISLPYLKKLSKPVVFKQPKVLSEFISFEGASFHNLANLSGKIPLKGLVGIVGVSGSGKSTLISEVLFPHLSNYCNRSSLKTIPLKTLDGLEHLDKVIEIDQAPIGKSPRSNPATYIKLWDDIRELFGMLPESVALGLSGSHFSFNTKSGTCLSCSGLGMIKIDMDFMEEAFLECPHCLGKRFDQKTLSVRYKNHSIYDVLKMTVREALELFKAIPKIYKKLTVLSQVGLDYLTLGQSSTTLSGGEAQRIKLAKELSRPSSGKTLYIFDEPTTGLHAKDIDKLLKILQALVDQGNTAWIIEHNLELMKACDYLLEMGPGAGALGGQIIAQGTPESFLSKDTLTALALSEVKKLKASKKHHKEAFNEICVIGASEHNLKGVSAKIPYGQITVCSGPSGSGKSSFAFDTVYAEGQRRYSDSLPNWAQSFIKLAPKPKLEKISGLLAAIAIEQRGHVGNPRSTVGTMTEIYDYLRVLYAHKGQAVCPQTLSPIRAITCEFVLDEVFKLEPETKLQVLAPVFCKTQDDFDYQLKQLAKEGYLRIYVNDVLFELDEQIPFNPRLKNQILVVIDRVKVSLDNKTRIYEALKNAAGIGKNQLYLLEGEKKRYFNLSFAAVDTGKSYPSLTPSSFSFNSEEGMCPDCSGLGQQFFCLKLDVLSEDDEMWIDLADQLLLGGLPVGYEKPLEKYLSKHNSSLYAQVKDGFSPFLEPQGEAVVLAGDNYRLKLRGLQKASAKAALHAKSPFKGKIAPYLSEKTCATCHGERLNPLSRHVHIQDVTLGALCKMPLKEALLFLNQIIFTDEEKEILKEALTQIASRLQLTLDIGLSYLSLSRTAGSLSGGEAQRVRLSQQLGSGLTGCLYVLDEPTIGLHPHNNALLNAALLKIKERGNTLLLVEHDPMTIAIADQILDFGPKAGTKGGQIIARGSLGKILKDPQSLTGQYLSKKQQIPAPKEIRKPKEFITCKDVVVHNLKQVDVTLPLGVLCGITGVSGSGKSSLIKTFLHEALKLAIKTRSDEFELPEGKITGASSIEKLVMMTQDPMGTTARADVSTYIDVMTPLRQFFAELPSAKTYGLQGKHFSFNHRAGMCQKCWGLGYKKVKLQYLPDVRVACETCHGFRLNSLSLTVKYQGKNIGELLKLTVNEAALIFPQVPKILKKIALLQEVGLGYLPLDQEIAKLSGGEGQRLRLAKELSKRSCKKTLYLLDEPTVGLHPSDIALLIPIFQKMIYQGASFVIIEHNLDVLKSCDYLIEMGPGAGLEGGQVIAQGTTREICLNQSSITGPYLRKELETL